MSKALISIMLALLSCAAQAATDVRTTALDGKSGLSKPISLYLRAASLREVLDKIQSETGVKLRPERDIAEDKVTISVKDKPAREVLRAITHCFNLCWEEAEVADTTCLKLFTDRDFTSAIRRRNYDDYAAILGQFDKEMQAHADVVRSGIPYQAPARSSVGMKNNDEYWRLTRRQQISHSDMLSAMVLQYLKLSDMQKKPLFEGQEISLPKEAICQEAKEKFSGASEFRYWVDPSLAGYLLYGSNVTRSDVDGPHLFAVAVFDDDRYDKEIQSACDILAKDAALDKELPVRKQPEKAAPPQPAAVSTDAPTEKLFRLSQQAVVPNPGAGSAATPTTMSDFLLPIAEDAGIPLVAQYISEYADPQVPTPPPAGKILARLCQLCKQHKFTISRDGDFLLVKSMVWHRLRDREVPETKIKRWQQAFTGLPFPTWDAAVEMGASPWGWIRDIIANQRYWFGSDYLMLLAGSEYQLKLCASLSAAEQNALWRGVEIPIAGMRPEQLHLFMQAFESKAKPTYAKAKDSSWPRKAGISLAGPELLEEALYAVADMRGLGMCRTDSLVPDGAVQIRNDLPPDQQQEQYNRDRRKWVEQNIGSVAKDACRRLAAEHPEIPPKNITIYALYRLLIELHLGEDSNGTSWVYSIRVK